MSRAIFIGNEAVQILRTLQTIWPETEITFTNNKVQVTKIVYDFNSNSVNFR